MTSTVDPYAEGMMQLSFVAENLDLREALRTLVAAAKPLTNPDAHVVVDSVRQAVDLAEAVLARYEAEVVRMHPPSTDRVREAAAVARQHSAALGAVVITDDDGEPE